MKQQRETVVEQPGLNAGAPSPGNVGEALTMEWSSIPSHADRALCAPGAATDIVRRRELQE